MNRDIRSRAWSLYNRLRKYARVHPVLIDINRLNRAIGIVNSTRLMAEDEFMYSATSEECSCPDMQYRLSQRRKGANGERYTGVCKHVLAHRLLEAKESPVEHA